jgi:hypothetical protein
MEPEETLGLIFHNRIYSVRVNPQDMSPRCKCPIDLLPACAPTSLSGMAHLGFGLQMIYALNAK